MRAFYTNLNNWGPWGFAGREYLRLVRSMGPYVVRGTTAVVAGDVKTPGLRVLDAATHRVLREQAQWTNPPTATFYHGWLRSLERIDHVYTPPGGVSVAIVNWPGDELPDVETLKRFTCVWTSTRAQAELLRGVGLAASCVPVPLNRDLEIARVSAGGGLRMVVAAGDWTGADDLRGITASFLGAFDASSGYGLHLVSPRLKLGADVLCELDPQRRPFDELPPVSVAPAEPDSTEAWLNLLAYCDAYYSVRDDVAGDYFALLAAQAGCRVTGRRAVAEAFASVQAEGQCYRVPDDVEPGAAIRLAVERTAPADPSALYGAEDAFAAAVVAAVARGAELRAQEPQLRLGVVVAHRDQGYARLATTLRCLCPQLLEDDVVVISDQSDDPEAWDAAGAVAKEYEAELVSVPAAEARVKWSMARCRNAGARVALAAGAEVLLFVDAGVLLPQSAVWQMRHHIGGPDSDPAAEPAQAPDLGAARRIRKGDDLTVSDPRLVNALHQAPARRAVNRDCVTVMVCQGEELLSPDAAAADLGGDWAADKKRSVEHPGNLMVRGDLFKRLRGYDEAYPGQGYEDWDFKLRAQGWHQALWLEELGVVAYRQPGVQVTAYPSVSDARLAEGRFKARQGALRAEPGPRDDKKEVNPHGWGRL